MISPIQKQLESLKNKAVAKHKQGQREEAIALYLNALQFEEHQSDWIYGNVITLFTEIGKIEQGLELAAEALKNHPDSDVIYRAMGLALNQQENFNGAVEHYLKALSLNIHQPDWLYAYLIANLFEQQQFQAAIDLGKKGSLIYPDCYWINYHLGNSYAALEQWHEALNSYQKAASKNQKTAELQEKIDFILQKNSLNIRAKNVVRYLATISANPQQLDAYYKLLYEDYKTVLLLLNLALNLAENNNFNNALQYYQQAVTLNARLVDFYLNQQSIFLRQVVTQETIHRLQEGAEFTNKNDLTLKKHPTRNFLRHRYCQQLAIYHQALESYPHEVEIYLEIALIYAQQNRLIKAISFCQRAVKLEPHNVNAELILAQLQKRQTKFYARMQNVVGTTPEYSVWLEKRRLQNADIDWLPENIDTLGYQPLISIIVAVENIPDSYLREMLESVRFQIYPYWELCLVAAASIPPQIREILEDYQTQDLRIKLISEEQAESLAAMANAALAVATGDFVTFVRAEDQLAPTALSEIVEFLNLHPEADLLYADEDQVNEAGQYFAPHFKPNWCPDSLLSRMYTGDLSVYRHSIIQELGGLQLGYGKAANYDLTLRFTEKTVNIFHLPQILYHRRKIASEAIAPKTNSGNQDKDIQDEQKAIADALTRRQEQGEVIEHPEVPGIYTLRYQITDYKLVSIIIPTKNLGKVLDQCLQSIFTHSTYPHYEVIIIDNGTDEADSLSILSQWQEQEPHRCFVYQLDMPFNYSKLNNFGVEKAKGDYLLFLNNDIEVITEDWIEGMVEQAQRSSIGAVGAMLLYPDHKIQHGGVILGIRGVASHSHKNFAYGDPGYTNQLISINNYSAVTAACLMCRREVFTQVNGFDEALPVTFNDVDFCLKIRQQDYHNVWLSHVVLYHHESQSRGSDQTPEEKARFRQEVAQMETRWGDLIAQDPCYNINLSKTAEDYSLSIN